MNRFLTEVELRKSNIKCSNTLCDDKKPNMKLCFINTKEVFRCMNTKCKRYISASNFQLQSVFVFTNQDRKSVV